MCIPECEEEEEAACEPIPIEMPVTRGSNRLPMKSRKPDNSPPSISKEAVKHQ
jgi:hypothetical protein